MVEIIMLLYEPCYNMRHNLHIKYGTIYSKWPGSNAFWITSLVPMQHPLIRLVNMCGCVFVSDLKLITRLIRSNQDQGVSRVWKGLGL